MRIKLWPKKKKANLSKPAKRITSRKIRGIDGARFRFTAAGLKILRDHPFVYQVVNEIVVDQLTGLNLLSSGVKTKKVQGREVVRVVDDFKKQKQMDLFEQTAPFFRITKRLNFGEYIIEKVVPEQGKTNIAMYRVTSKTGESVLVKIQPQDPEATSRMRSLQTARELGHKTPDYFLEFDFPKFNVQVLEAMKLPNMKQLQRTNPITYRLIKNKFRKNALDLGRAGDLDIKEGNCLVLIKRGKTGYPKPQFYWFDL